MYKMLLILFQMRFMTFRRNHRIANLHLLLIIRLKMCF